MDVLRIETLNVNKARVARKGALIHSVPQERHRRLSSKVRLDCFKHHFNVLVELCLPFTQNTLWFYVM